MEQRFVYINDVECTTIYELVCSSIGAGQLKPETFVTYKDLATGQCYTRTSSEFNTRMKPYIIDGAY